jgi:hypothetical protein
MHKVVAIVKKSLLAKVVMDFLEGLRTLNRGFL